MKSKSHIRLLPCRWLCAAVLLAGCAKEPPPPRSVSEFLGDPNILEATMVRCAQDRSKMKYEAECVNAREAANRLAKVEEEARRKQLEEQSQRKRKALRRIQETKAEARRRAAEARKRREEAEYLGIYETESGTTAVGPSQAPVRTVPAAAQNEPVTGANQPGMTIAEPEPQSSDARESAPTTSGTDIDAIREELKRRQDSGS